MNPPAVKPKTRSVGKSELVVPRNNAVAVPVFERVIGLYERTHLEHYVPK